MFTHSDFPPLSRQPKASSNQIK
uniref:Uncharacterized protein n=1 Tax=Rhizophora mucronata TaxID=61149 RepID=A0A2P2PME1_RHIMU